jgi:IS66 C-terminal element
MYSLIVTAKMNGVDPQAWLTDILARIATLFGEDGIRAFTDFGVENLIELVRIYKENPTWPKR